MADDVRLYMFECGTLKCHVENIKMNQGLGEEYEIPVPWFLVTHPKGNVVIDGGNAPQCATDPHGHSVIVTAPAAFRFTYEAMPERHHQVAELLAGEPIDDPGPDTLPEVLRTLMRDVDAPSGVAELGYTEDDVPALVEGAMKQQRLLVVAPREVGESDLTHILNASMTNW